MNGVPLPAGLCLMLTGLAVAWWCHRQIVIDGDAAHGRVLAAALAFGAVDALVATALMANLVAGGLTRLPFLHFPLFVGPLAVMYVRDLTRLQRATTAAGFAATFMAAYLFRAGAVREDLTTHRPSLGAHRSKEGDQPAAVLTMARKIVRLGMS
ncbi:hypothetical protein ACIBK9_50135 [Nonomuraea sp. NPDC050227]|uniref:hypothetical protein n=1 Tax=Nonomuraea sp. NPDC050227 TaxID=3364360 RepID=UPI00378D7891